MERMLASARLVTVTGAGGCGKSRLSLEVAERAVSSAQHTPAVVIEVASAANAERGASTKRSSASLDSRL